MTGYGHSTGSTTESSINEAEFLAYHYCVDHLRSQRVVLLGKLLGTGAAMFLASRKDISGTAAPRGSAAPYVSPLASDVRTLSAANYMTKSAVLTLDSQFMPNITYAKDVSSSCIASTTRSSRCRTAGVLGFGNSIHLCYSTQIQGPSKKTS